MLLRPVCGSARGTAPEVTGLLQNPNNEFPLNYVPLRTLAEFVRCDGNWDARREYLAAMSGWLPSFQTAGAAISLQDLVLLGDCYYLPYEEGPEAESLYAAARQLWAAPPSEWARHVAAFREPAMRLRNVCASSPNCSIAHCSTPSVARVGIARRVGPDADVHPHPGREPRGGLPLRLSSARNLSRRPGAAVAAIVTTQQRRLVHSASRIRPS